MGPEGESGAKTYLAGTHRVVHPSETLERVGCFKPVMGITRVADVTGLDDIGIPVIMVCRPNSRGLAVSQGKGLDLDAAKASGVMESIEGYHAERITLPLKLAAYEELRYTHRVVDVERLPRIAGGLYRPSRTLLWIEADDLRGGDRTWLPFEMVHTNYTLPLPSGSGCFPASSNGLASGNHPLEALSHAICEVVERDATTLWNLLPDEARQATRLDLSTVDEPSCRGPLDCFERAGLHVAAWETTSDVGIPAFTCIIADGARRGLRPLYSARGTGCHPARSVALARALTEAAQSRLTFIAGSRDNLSRRSYVASQRDEVLAQERVLVESAGARDFRNGPGCDQTTLQEDVTWELGRLSHAGMEEVLTVDLTKREFGIPVVRVVIPGLEGSDEVPGHVPGERALRQQGRR